MTPDNKPIGNFGLCADCLNARKIASSKGSEFLLCELSKFDPRFPKYPRLPVLSCSGYRCSGHPKNLISKRRSS
jgi:hypothetical protein